VLDRIDLQIEVPALTFHELEDSATGDASEVVRARVCAARERQRVRGTLNAELSHAALRRACPIDRRCRRLMREAMDRGGMSARGIHRALRVARTIADLDGGEVGEAVLAEALQYRVYERRRFGVG